MKMRDDFMKVKSWLSLIIIGAGMVLLGIGIWQITSMNIKTKDALAEAKQIVKEKKVQRPSKDDNPIKDNAPVKTSKDTSSSTLGILEIPRIKKEFPIVEGTDPDNLEKGVGHFKGSSMPAENGQIVLSGHRDTVFRRLGELKIGDQVIIKVSKGKYSYQITRTKIVEANDKSIITLQKQHEELILTTCYPFGYIGNAPQRYIVYAKPI